jgi:hypothetical protein
MNQRKAGKMNTFIPYENKNIDTEEHLLNILKHHSRNTPYWQKKISKKSIEEIVSSNLEETIYNLSKLEVDQSLLRTDWLLFKPEDTKNVRCSFSSGTTGPQKYCLWSEDYIEKQTKYLSYYVSKKGIKAKSAIIQGPTSVYKDVNEAFICKIGGTPYFVGLRVEGLKPIIEKAAAKGQEEVTKVVKEYFGPEIEKTRRFLEYDKEINFMRSAWMMLAPFELFFGDKRNVETVMVSGLGYNFQHHQMLRQKFKRVISSYGYFAFGDALGRESGNLEYYPAFPYAIFTVVKDNGEIARYGEEGHPLFIIARKDLLLILREGKELATRARPCEEFPWDGIGNPRRII